MNEQNFIIPKSFEPENSESDLKNIVTASQFGNVNKFLGNILR